MESIGLRRAGTFTNYVVDGQVNSDGSYTIQLHDGRYYTLNVQDRTGTGAALDERKWERATTLMLTMLEKKGLLDSSAPTIGSIGGTNVSAQGIKKGASSAIEHKNTKKGRAQTVREYQEFSALVNGRRPEKSNGSKKAKKKGSHYNSDNSPARVQDEKLDKVLNAMQEQAHLHADLTHRNLDAMQKQFHAMQEANAMLQAELREANGKKDAIIDATLKQQAEFIEKLSKPEEKPASDINNPLNAGENNAAKADVVVKPPLEHALDTIQQQSAATHELFTEALEQITAANDKKDQLLADRFAAQDAFMAALLPKQAGDTESESDDAPELLIQSGAFSPMQPLKTEDSDVSKVLDVMQKQFNQMQEANARMQEQLLQANERTQEMVVQLVKGNQDLVGKVGTTTPDLNDLIQGLGNVLDPQNKALDKHLDSNTQVIAALADALTNPKPSGSLAGAAGGIPLNEAAVDSVIEDKNVRALHEAILGLQKSNNNEEVLETLARFERKVNTSIPSEVVEVIRNDIDQLRQDYREQMQRFDNNERNHAEEQTRLNEHIRELIKLIGQKDLEVKAKGDDIQRIEGEINNLRNQIADHSKQAAATEALRKSMEENFRRLFELLGGKPQSNQEAQQEIEALQGQINELRAREDNAHKQIEALQQQVTQKDAELNKRGNLSKRQVNELEGRNQEMEKRLQELERTNNSLFAEQNKAKGEIEKLTHHNQALTKQVEDLLNQLANDQKAQADLIKDIRKKIKAETEAKDRIIEEVISDSDRLHDANAKLQEQIEHLEGILKERNVQIDDFVRQLAEANANRGITPTQVAQMRKELIEMYSGSDRIARACCKGQVRRRVFGRGAPTLKVGTTNHKLTPTLEEAMWTTFGIGHQYENVLREVKEEQGLHKEIQALERKADLAEAVLRNLQKHEESRQEATQLIDQLGLLKVDCARALVLPEDHAGRDAQEGNKNWFRDHLIREQNKLRQTLNQIIAAGKACAGSVGQADLFNIQSVGLIK